MKSHAQILRNTVAFASSSWRTIGMMTLFVLAFGVTAPAQEQNQTQGPEQQGGGVIRFVRDPDAAPEFAVKGIDGSTVNLANAREPRACV